MKLNKKWHEANKLPKNATLEERIVWHTEHLKNCQCRNDLPKKLKEEMVKRRLL